MLNIDVGAAQMNEVCFQKNVQLMTELAQVTSGARFDPTADNLEYNWQAVKWGRCG